MSSNHSGISVIKPWGLTNFENLPSFRFFPFSCRYCAYWECLDFEDKITKENGYQIKQKWLSFIRKEFGNCGFIAYLNEKPVGFAQYGPMSYFPRLSEYHDFTPSSEAIFLSCLYIPAKQLRRQGIGKQLLEGVISDLQNRGYRLIETLVRIHNTPSHNPSDWLIRPLEFFVKMNFKVIKQKGEIAHLRKTEKSNP
ncbi:MAG: GNAT family N-acetyltransferase [Candidatus Hodarchaeota archaeon]